MQSNTDQSKDKDDNCSPCHGYTMILQGWSDIFIARLVTSHIVLGHVYQLSLSSLERLVSQACFYKVGRLVSEAVF